MVIWVSLHPELQGPREPQKSGSRDLASGSGEYDGGLCQVMTDGYRLECV